MESTVVRDPLVLVLADGDSQGAISYARGHLFEQFVANLLHSLGYEKPTTLSLNVTSAGVELDLSVRHQLDKVTALAECKAYTSPVKSDQLAAFYGKLSATRLDEGHTRGLFVAIPRLTGDGHELAKKISSLDKSFQLITAIDLWGILTSRGELVLPEATARQLTDEALIVHSSGIYAACLEIDSATKTAARVLMRAKSGGVHPEALRLLSENPYAQGLNVHDVAEGNKPAVPRAPIPEQTIVEVNGSQSDFEYQLPASPKFFIGRRTALRTLSTQLAAGSRLFVLNAQSGWGKSSLALTFAAQVRKTGGHALVIDARTANTAAYAPSVLRRAAESAQSAGLLTLTASTTWASLQGAVKSLEDATWKTGPGQLLVFFDQFENVFKDEDLTRTFRDLALLTLDSGSRLVIGFAWKTDFVGWTENHPYQLRDEIRSSASLVALEPFGPSDVDTILSRLQKEVGSKLSREIRQRLREYSQGLPWLLKKLSGHLIQEFKAGKSQEQLVAEALNVANLFESDLAHLSPSERETLNFVARYAPVQASEVTERFNVGVVQSLLDQRLIVQVGEKLDTYWDTFRDYLNTGRAPIEDSYILRQTPGSVARLLTYVLSRGGDVSVTDVTHSWETSENVVWNVARELRQLGLALYKSNQIQLAPEIMDADDIEAEVRRRVSGALRRHRAFSVFTELAERGQSAVTTSQFAHQLESVFPAVEVAGSTWLTYARIFIAWFEYAGLLTLDGAAARMAADGAPGKGTLTSTSSGPRTSSAFPTVTPGQSLAILRDLASGSQHLATYVRPAERRALQQLLILGAVKVEADVVSVVDGLVHDGDIVQPQLLALLSTVRGGKAALNLLNAEPATDQFEIGRILRDEYGAAWVDSTVKMAGKSFRAWAKAAGVRVIRGKGESNDHPTGVVVT
ncbi:hypothetical protein B7R22_18285 [Subtercola boreus]|uniref:Uncharacterized protein n=1 Tax=Subtercola boreus TaxID=120213 RepID=A0A3E0VPQ5_9MICO|nr:restriction endonuclease [Subtercola boreus]RFA11701.1 hypothetical protein B7R22_18285 [Subtercola boreus]